MEKYLIGGIPALEIANKFGTPIYVYDVAKIKIQYDKLSSTFSNIDHHIHYACKANESTELLRYINGLGAGVDTVSPNEIRRALKVGFSKEEIIYTPSFPSLEEIRFALKENICVHFGSLEYIEILGAELKGREIGIRLNPAVDISGNQKISTAHMDSKFGVPLTQLETLKRLLHKYDIRLTTLHVHTGSDIGSWMELKRSFDVLISLLPEFEDVSILDIGSGLKIKYGPDDKAIDVRSYADHIEKEIEKLDRPIRIIIEPGKYLVGNAGYLMTRVNMVKQGYNKVFAGVDSGFHHLIRPMYYDVRHHIVNISNRNGDKFLYDVVGQLCEEDTFASDVFLNKVNNGDILVFEHSGAYTYAMSMQYNLRDKPKEILIKEGKATIISEDRIVI